MPYNQGERDDFDYGKRIYRQKPKGNPPFLFMITLVVVLAGLIFVILYKRSIEKTPVPDYDARGSPGRDRPVVSQVENNKENHDGNHTAGETLPGTDANTDTDTDKYTDTDTTYPSILKRIYGKTDIQPPSGEMYGRAEQYFKAGSYKEALPLYKELAITDNKMLVFLGICYYETGDYPNAREYLENALEADENNAMALKYLALTCYKLDDLKNSLRYAEASLEIQLDAKLQAHCSKLKREIKAMEGYGNTSRVNFNIIFSKFEHNEVRFTVIDILENAYREIGQQMDTYPSTPVSVILYNEKNFFDVTRAPGWAGGLFDGKIHVPIRGMKLDEPLLKRILYHEYTHALVHTITSKCPRWLNEGLSDYFSLEPGQIETIGQIIPLKHLEVGFPTGNPRLVVLAYWESYSAVSYLVDRYKLYRIKELLQDLGRGTDLNTAFFSAFSITYDRFVNTWGKE
ncbi:MAG: tetratricopeptide repeat protein [Candidatus Aminicenantes bacterium]|nr:MAG: tetratricopeptide repeat protein [Candidatus Aminicenantes bacterium]